MTWMYIDGDKGALFGVGVWSSVSIAFRAIVGIGMRTAG